MISNTGFFAGKTIVIYGASRGIGLAIAKKLAADNANIVILAKSVTENPRLLGTIFSAAKEVEEAGGRCLPLRCDIRDEHAVCEAVQKTVEVFGGIDILVNNSSAISLADTEQLDMKLFDLMQQVNLRGTYLLTKTCLPYLKSGANPHVLTISPPLSMDQQWFQHHTAYTISKYGMSMAMLGMSAEFQQHGIAANSLWLRICVWTAAMAMLKRNEPGAQLKCRKPETMADAAYAMLQQPTTHFTGQFMTDEQVLRKSGIEDMGIYAYDPNAKDLIDDLFIPGLQYNGPSGWGISTYDSAPPQKQPSEQAKL